MEKSWFLNKNKLQVFSYQDIVYDDNYEEIKFENIPRGGYCVLPKISKTEFGCVQTIILYIYILCQMVNYLLFVKRILMVMNQYIVSK